MGRPSQKSQYIFEVIRLYNEEKWSLSEIHQELGPSVQTLSRWIQSEGITLEPRPRNPNEGRSAEQQAEINARVSASRSSKGTGPRVQREVRVCPVCSEKFTASPADKKQFCGRACARSVEASEKAARFRADWEANPLLCGCGKAIPYEQRHIAKYCSHECRKTYGAKRQKNPDNYLTFKCLGCGKEVTRLKRYSTYTKYCSNACARRHTKTKKHIVVDDAVVLDSGYEALLWGMCSVAKVQIQRYPREDGVAWNHDGWYAPDFLVDWQGRQVAVETKGFADPEDEARWAAFRSEKDVPLVILTGDNLMPFPASREELLKLLGLA
ncbi:hypothetical protein OG497_37580 [Streptomyces sp. NBC_01242]|uniref:hypothetical protein n=1 Tax=Streptomyces sp. NBC_01242 TaxID=2903795 RepID=UPI0022569B9C|nr:hypothetical protein [Streptomyces sp. NBC_01242]MCX4799569.1 hypothetical protein [Streptomyces sp. NBC_01242]